MNELRQQIPGSDAHVFIQYKNTKLCMEFWCPCGHDGHVCSYFVHNLRCKGCGSVFALGTQVLVRRIESAEGIEVYDV